MSVLKNSLVAFVIACLAHSAMAAGSRDATTLMGKSEFEQIKGIVDNLLGDNNEFAKSHDAAYFRPLIAGQMPRATVVTCSDSRVHTHAFDKTPDGDLFVVRNIGNQLTTSEGSVEYGVHHLHTPLLIFIGHSSCGAIKAASGNYAKESRAIKRELASIRIAKGKSGMEGVLVNVNNQVAVALKKFRREVARGDLTVIGAVYDFSNDLGRGFGKLNIVNLNGETDSTRIGAGKLLSRAAATEEKPMADKDPGKDAEASRPTATGPSPTAYSYP